MEFLMNFYSFNITSDYSFLESLITENALKNSAKTKGYAGFGVADDNSLLGVASFADSLSNSNIKFFVEYKTVLEFPDFKAKVILISKNEDGYLDLVKICNLKKESMTLENLVNYNLTNLAIIILTTEIELNINNLNSNKEILENLNKETDLYFGVELYSNDDIQRHQDLYRFFDDNNFKAIVSPSVRYINSNESKSFYLAADIGGSTNAFLSKNYSFHLLLPQTLKKIYREKDIIETSKLGDSVNYNFYDIKKGHLFSLYGSKDEDFKVLKNKVNEGLARLNLQNDQAYLNRVEEELNTIHKKSFSSYFLIVADYVNYAKNNDIKVGPGRGSAGGCLCSYLLNITEIDPLKYNLSFSRFLNEQRKDYPDIDIDFEDTKRNLVIEYLKNKYSPENVVNIITYTSFKPRSVLKSVGTKLNYSPEQISLITNSISLTAKNFDDELSTNSNFQKVMKNQFVSELVNQAKPLLNLKNNTSIHPAGIILSPTKVDTVIPVTYNQNLDIAGFEYQFMEKLGFVKMDILGLSNLSFLRKIEEYITEINGVKDFSINDLIDKQTYEVLNKLLLSNIFQLNGAGISYAIKQIKIENFNQLIAILALYRPGPMDNIPTYANRKNGLEKITYITPLLKPILEDTYGIIIYQEQIIEICNKICHLTQSEADLFRKAMSKKDEKKMLIYKDKFISGAIQSGLTNSQAYELYNLVFKFSQYGFNKSHTVSYAMITYRLLYYKAHYPKAFYIASFENESINDNFVRLINELPNFNLKLRNPSVKYSTNHYRVVDNNIYMPLKAIKNIDDTTISAILHIQDRENLESFFAFLYGLDKSVNLTKNLSGLVNSGSVDCFKIGRNTLLSNKDTINLLFEMITSKDDGFAFEHVPGTISVSFLKEKEAIGIFNSVDLYKYFKIDRAKYKIFLATDDERTINDSTKVILSTDETKNYKIKYDKRYSIKPYDFFAVKKVSKREVEREIYDRITILKENHHG